MKYIIFLSFIFLLACSPKTKETTTQQTFEINDHTIVSSFAAKPHYSINMELLEAHYATYPERWKIAFDYLSQLNKDSLNIGRVDLSNDVYVSVNTYETKSQEEVYYESHKKYIDIQYVISGNEYIGLTNNTDMPIKTAYDATNDLLFYSTKEGILLEATPNFFFIFFPNDLHCPCIQIQQSSTVTKVVVKIKID